MLSNNRKMSAADHIGRNYAAQASSVRRNLPQINVQEAIAITPTLARVRATHQPGAEFTNADMEAGFAAAFKGELRYVDNSGVYLNGHTTRPMFDCFVAANVISRVVADKDIADKYKQVRANLFMDEEDNTWKVESSDNGEKRLVRRDAPDLTKLLLQARQFAVTATLMDDEPAVDGDYVMYAHPQKMEMRFGYLFNNNGTPCVLDYAARQGQVVTANTVVLAFDLSSWGPDNTNKARYCAPSEMIVQAAVSGDAATRIMDYFSRLYRQYPEFYRRFNEQVAKRKALGPNGLVTELYHTLVPTNR